MNPEYINELTDGQVKLLSLAKNAAAALGRDSISLAEFRKETGISEYKIAREFGGWVELAKLAGFDVLNRYRSEELTEEDIFKEMDRVFRGAGRRVNQVRFESLSKYGTKLIRGKFGSWGNAINGYAIWQQAGGAELESKSHGLGNSLAREASSHAGYNNAIDKGIDDFHASDPPTADHIPTDIFQYFLEVSDRLDRLEERIDASLKKMDALILHLLPHQSLSHDPMKLTQGATITDIGLSQGHNAMPLPRQFLVWLASCDRIRSSDLRIQLLPFGRLISEVLDDLNERALDLVGEPALEEDGDEIIVFRDILTEVVTQWCPRKE